MLELQPEASVPRNDPNRPFLLTLSLSYARTNPHRPHLMPPAYYYVHEFQQKIKYSKNIRTNRKHCV